MPEIKSGETEKNYVRRCIPYVMKHEGATQRQAAGKCYGMFRQHRSKARRRANAG